MILVFSFNRSNFHMHFWVDLLHRKDVFILFCIVRLLLPVFEFIICDLEYQFAILNSFFSHLWVQLGLKWVLNWFFEVLFFLRYLWFNKIFWVLVHFQGVLLLIHCFIFLKDRINFWFISFRLIEHWFVFMWGWLFFWNH